MPYRVPVPSPTPSRRIDCRLSNYPYMSNHGPWCEFHEINECPWGVPTAPWRMPVKGPKWWESIVHWWRSGL